MFLFHRYLNRFSEEIETIKLKQSISKNRANQHASRMGVLQINMEREKGEYEGAGIGMILQTISFPDHHNSIVVSLNFRTHGFM